MLVLVILIAAALGGIAHFWGQTINRDRQKELDAIAAEKQRLVDSIGRLESAIAGHELTLSSLRTTIQADSIVNADFAKRIREDSAKRDREKQTAVVTVDGVPHTIPLALAEERQQLRKEIADLRNEVGVLRLLVLTERARADRERDLRATEAREYLASQPGRLERILSDLKKFALGAAIGAAAVIGSAL